LKFIKLEDTNFKATTLFFAILALNLIVKGMFLGANSLAGDEPFSVYHSQMSLSAIIRLLAEGNNPPLYEVLLHFWIKLFGISEFSVRFPSLLFSTITVGFIYKIGDKFFNRNIALLSCLIFIFSNYHIYLAHESRTYTLLGMLTSISMYYYMGIIKDTVIAENKIPTSNFVMLGIVDSLLGYCHYFGLLILFVQFIYAFIYFQIIRTQLKKLLLTSLIIFLLYLPNIQTIIHRFQSSSGGTWITPLDGLNSLYNMLMYFSNAPLVTVFVLIVWISAIVYFFSQKSKKINPLNGFVVFWFCMIFLGMYFVSFKTPIFLDRYLMPSAIAFPILIAISCNYILKNKKWHIAISMAMGILFISTVNPVSSNQLEIRECVTKLKQLKKQNTVVYICPDWLDLNFAYYYNQSYFKDYNDQQIKKNIYKYLGSDQIFPIQNSKQINLQKLNKAKHIIYLDDASNIHYPKNKIKEQLDQYFRLKRCISFKKNYTLYEFDLE
jgi:mannosyltransferase